MADKNKIKLNSSEIARFLKDSEIADKATLKGARKVSREVKKDLIREGEDKKKKQKVTIEDDTTDRIVKRVTVQNYSPENWKNNTMQKAAKKSGGE